MMKFLVPLAILALAPIQGAQAGATAEKKSVVGCHPEWNKGGCRTQDSASAHASKATPAACHPEWGKSIACAARVASAARESAGQAAKAEQSSRVATAQ